MVHWRSGPNTQIMRCRVGERGEGRGGGGNWVGEEKSGGEEWEEGEGRGMGWGRRGNMVNSPGRGIKGVSGRSPQQWEKTNQPVAQSDTGGVSQLVVGRGGEGRKRDEATFTHHSESTN